MHSRPHRGEHHHVAAADLVRRQLSLPDQIEQRRDRGHGAVAEPGDRHRHHLVVRRVVDPVQLVERVEDGLVHLAVGLMDQHFLHFADADAGAVERLLDRAGHVVQRVLVELPPLHLQEERLDEDLLVVRMPHEQHAGVLERVGADGVREDAVVRVAGLQDRGAGAVGVDQAVAVVRVGDARERLRADDHGPLAVAGADHLIGQDHPLQPSRTSEEDVEGHGARRVDLESRLHARGKRRHLIDAVAAVAQVAEVVRDDDGVERFGIDARRL